MMRADGVEFRRYRAALGERRQRFGSVDQSTDQFVRLIDGTSLGNVSVDIVEVPVRRCRQRDAIG
jgi:hypothetical protein